MSDLSIDRMIALIRDLVEEFHALGSRHPSPAAREYRAWVERVLAYMRYEPGIPGLHIVEPLNQRIAHYCERPDPHGESEVRLSATAVCTLLENQLREYGVSREVGLSGIHFESLLHPKIRERCLQLFLDGHYPDAVFRAVQALAALIGAKVGSKEDGAKLVDFAFPNKQPRLLLSDVEDERVGFAQILRGAFVGIRNPNAHALNHDLDQTSAAQYLIFASLMARWVDSAKAPK